MLSLPHLIIIFLVALIVFGPEKIPELARGLGKVMGEFRRATGDLRSGFEEQMRELEREATIAESRKRAASRAAAASQAATSAPAALPESSAAGQPQNDAAIAAENSILPPSEPAAENRSAASAETAEAPAIPAAPAGENNEKAIHGDAEPA